MTTTQVGARAPGSPGASPVEPTGSSDDRGGRLRAGLLLGFAFLLVQGAQLLLLRWLSPRFFWFDDSQAQFGPMAWWLGQHLEGGRPPTLAADLGMAGNLTADMQYGVLDPLHWGLHAMIGSQDDLLRASWLYGGLCVLLLGAGVLVLVRGHGVRPVLALAAAVGASTSGFFLWYGSSWWPLLWSLAWLPWFWAALVSRGRWSPPVLFLATWALLASGNPYVLFFPLVLVVAHAVELVRAQGSVVLKASATLSRLLAMVAGLVVALPSLAALVQSSAFVSRQSADPVIGNSGFGVTNLADVLLGSPTLMGQTNAWSGSVGLAPAMGTLLVALPLLALVDWRAAVRRRGVLIALTLYAVSVVFTQLPTTVSVFRYPVRYLVVVQIALAVLAVIAYTTAPRVDRRRLLAAGGVIVAQFLLAWFRSPVFLKWHLLGAMVAVAALAALVVWGRRDRRRVAHLAAGGLLVSAVAIAPFVGVGMMISLQDRLDALAGSPATTAEQPHRELYGGQQMGTTVQQYEDQSVLDGSGATVVAYDFGPDAGWADGVFRGNGNLIAGAMTGSGSYAVWQERQQEVWCRTYTGSTCADPKSLLAQAPGTGQTWVDLLSSDTVLLGDDVPAAVRDHFEQTWTDEGTDRGYTRFTRDDGLPGRVTDATGVQVSQPVAGDGLARGRDPFDRYEVTTGDEPGRLVFRVTWWPGMQVELDGRRLPTATVDGAVLAVDIPAGTTSGDLRVSFVPIGETLLWPALVVGGLLGVASTLWGLRSTARPGPRETGGNPSDGPSTAPVGRGGATGRRGVVRQLLSFLLGSGLGLLVDLTVFAVATLLGLTPGWANVLSASCAVVVVYVFVSRYSFDARRSRSTFALFLGWYAVSIIAFSWFIEGLHDLTGWAPFVCKLLSLPPSFAANYLASRVVFGRAARSRTDGGVEPGEAGELVPAGSARSAGTPSLVRTVDEGER